MNNHRLNYWSQTKQRASDSYFSEQILRPKYSTIAFFNFLKKNNSLNCKIVDLACGNGANLIYLAKKFNIKKKLLGIDINKYLIKKAINYSNRYNNLKFEIGNILNLKKKYKNKYDGFISLQTLSWLEDYEKAIIQMVRLNPKFICVSSLFWEDQIDFKIKLNKLKNDSYKRSVKSYEFYNIYSLKNYINFLKKKGYKKNIAMKFNIPKIIKQKNKIKMGTYTIKDGKQLIQLSGPLKMNWYFILSKKK